MKAKKKVVTIRTFDFSTLYTKIPHNLLKAALIEIIEFVFNGGFLMVFMYLNTDLFGENLRVITQCTQKPQLFSF